jgi:hypothetical protein
MSRDELLTKVAMEHSPEDWGEADTWTYDEHEYGWNEYQLRRTELINKPSWDDAPEWAEWLAQDEDGDWWWYECPIEVDDLDEEEWVEEHGVDGRLVRATSGTTPAGHDWRDTLEPRPEPQIKPKTCRHCDIAFTRPHVDGIPDDRCTRCDEEIKALWPEPETTTRWTSKTCTECGRTTAAKAGDDAPVCPGCVAVEYAEDSDAESALSQVLDDQMREAEEKWARGDMEARSKYHREVKPGVWIDVYDVLQAWGVKNAALQHLIKKALAPGQRGHKDLMTDMDDIVASAKRAKELEQ